MRQRELMGRGAAIRSPNSRWVALAVFCLVSTTGCWRGNETSDDIAGQAPKQNPLQATQVEQPGYYFKIFGTAPDDGPGKHFSGSCDIQDDHENLLLFSIHSPGHRNGGSKGGSNPPDIQFSNSMNMDWLPGLEASNYQSYRFNLRTQFEKKHDRISEKVVGLNEVARVNFGDQQTPIFFVDEVTKPGILAGYHAWFRVLETNQPPFLAGITGNLYAHLHLRNHGRTISDNDPWTRDKVIAIYESFYTQACFINYFEKYMPVRDDATMIIVD